MNECPICYESFGHAPGCPRGAEEDAEDDDDQEDDE